MYRVELKVLFRFSSHLARAVPNVPRGVERQFVKFMHALSEEEFLMYRVELKASKACKVCPCSFSIVCS